MAGCAVALAAYFFLGRNLLLGIAVGFLALVGSLLLG